jgi:hypothetical protein
MHPRTAQGSARPGAITEPRNRRFRLRCMSSVVSPFGLLCSHSIRLNPRPAFQAISAPDLSLLFSLRAVDFFWFVVLRYIVSF